jgi:hypothetical protein
MNILLRGLALVMTLHAASIFAEETVSPDKKVELQGFGTVGAVYHNTPGGVQYRRDISQTTDGARAGQLSFAQDSMLGVQGTAHANEQFSASVQVVSRLDVYGSFAPQISMAYLKYQTGEALVRVGRMAIETYMKGDSAEIGYSNLLIRQPVIYYPRTFEGIDAETTQPLGDGLIRVKGIAGRAVGRLVSTGSAPYDLAGSKGAGGGVEYSQACWTGRFALYSLMLKNELDALQPGSALATALASAPNNAQIFNTISMKDRRLINKSLAVAYDAGAIQGGAELSEISTHDWAVERSFYAFAGYRFEQLTPYISYSLERTARQFVSTGIPNGLSAQTDALNQALAAGQTNVWLNQSDIALGVRYDFARNKALKFQFERIRYQDPESIVDPGLSTTSAENRGYKTMNLLSVALDFVF